MGKMQGSVKSYTVKMEKIACQCREKEGDWVETRPERKSREREWASTAPTKCRGFRQDHYYKNQLRYRVNEERGEVKSGGKNA